VRIPRYLRVIGWTALFWIAVLAAIVVLVLYPSGQRRLGWEGLTP